MAVGTLYRFAHHFSQFYLGLTMSFDLFMGEFDGIEHFYF
ncbi:hypothetical protein SDC9_172567 [bioreactor metagenome]|uniref:Uncharacterized protein n=1 Tax=bioreactor metagenome TaxID=1076179 RepID=A0A645GG99_9ZZZZ